MANEHGSDQQRTAGENSHESEYGQRATENATAEKPRSMGNRGSEGSFGGESVGSLSGSADPNGSSIARGTRPHNQQADLGPGPGQPIGGNDSNTGSGTTLTQGADFEADHMSTSDEDAPMQDKPFIGSTESDSGEYLEEDISTGGSDSESGSSEDDGEA